MRLTYSYRGGYRRIYWGGLIAGICMMMLTSGCTIMAPHAALLQGNYHHSRGNFQQAMVFYFDALQYDYNRGHVYYNLGNVYYALGEGVAAEEMWQYAEEENNIDILFGVSFNRGVRYYEEGDFPGAYEQFRKALTIYPNDIRSKVNFEYTLRKIGGNREVGANEFNGANGTNGTSGENDVEERTADVIDFGQNELRILEYVRRKERQRWRQGQEEILFEDLNDW